MVAYPHQQLNTQSAKKGWLLKLRISQPKGIEDFVMPGNITKGRFRLASPTIDESQPVKHSLVINVPIQTLAPLI
tara:strand:+ start:387 stop:611 length:225 start_codon:yes stop_codon:yes gene_type:complete